MDAAGLPTPRVPPAAAPEHLSAATAAREGLRPADTVRAHLDLGTDDVTAEVRRVVALGATGTTDQASEGGTRVPMTDPAGLTFSVTARHGW